MQTASLQPVEAEAEAEAEAKAVEKRQFPPF